MPVPEIASTDYITAGIILAGGQSRRMGGGDKSLLRLEGQSLLARVIAALRPQCDALLISANGDPARFSAYGLPVIADTVEGFAGPLAGVLAGLDFVAAYLPEARFAVSVAGDTPFLPPDLVSRLHVAREKDGSEVACAQSGGRPHWIVALWPVAMRFALRHALVEENLRRMEGFLRRYALAQADWPSEPFDPFLNINEPADLVAAERILQEGLAPSHAL
ncbi:MAG: molybdenum cofactor guanylyltransferase MobA [Beijerinckiaceae bacterium]|nr:MAG: molybdenum cofactor guanylyltransferase MobA [Beijerinckiaceae bacterium]